MRLSHSPCFSLSTQGESWLCVWECVLTGFPLTANLFSYNIQYYVYTSTPPPPAFFLLKPKSLSSGVIFKKRQKQCVRKITWKTKGSSPGLFLIGRHQNPREMPRASGRKRPFLLQATCPRTITHDAKFLQLRDHRLLKVETEHLGRALLFYICIFYVVISNKNLRLYFLLPLTNVFLILTELTYIHFCQLYLMYCDILSISFFMNTYIFACQFLIFPSFV